MRRGLFFVMIIVAVVASGFSRVQGATLTVSVSGLDKISPDVIWSYQLNFGVTEFENWSFIYNSSNPSDATGSVIFNTATNHLWEVTNGVFITGWQLDANLTNSGELVVLANSFVQDPKDSPLLDGELFTVNYPDSVTISLTLDSFLLGSDFITPVPMLKVPTKAVFSAGDNELVLSPVPIPSTLLLLGGGLVGVFGLRRKKKKNF